jgi:hypothetical protein
MRWILQLALLLAMFSFASIAAAEPRLTIISPLEGASITGTTVEVKIGVGNFAIVPSDVPLSQAGKRPNLNQPGRGVVELRLDLLPTEILTSGTAFTFTNIPPGEHRLEVELTTIDHTPLSPRAVQTVRFRTVASGAVVAIDVSQSTSTTTTTMPTAPGLPTAIAAATPAIFQRLPRTAANDTSDIDPAFVFLAIFLIIVCGFVLLVSGQTVAFTEEVCFRLRSLNSPLPSSSDSTDQSGRASLSPKKTRSPHSDP